MKTGKTDLLLPALWKVCFTLWFFVTRRKAVVCKGGKQCSHELTLKGFPVVSLLFLVILTASSCEGPFFTGDRKPVPINHMGPASSLRVPDNLSIQVRFYSVLTDGSDIYCAVDDGRNAYLAFTLGDDGKISLKAGEDWETPTVSLDQTVGGNGSASPPTINDVFIDQGCFYVTIHHVSGDNPRRGFIGP